MACVSLELPYVNSLYLDRCFWILMGWCYPGEVATLNVVSRVTTRSGLKILITHNVDKP
jgi:hypothetical protein